LQHQSGVKSAGHDHESGLGRDLKNRSPVIDVQGKSPAGNTRSWLPSANYTAVLYSERKQNNILSTYHYTGRVCTVMGARGWFIPSNDHPGSANWTSNVRYVCALESLLMKKATDVASDGALGHVPPRLPTPIFQFTLELHKVW